MSCGPGSPGSAVVEAPVPSDPVFNISFSGPCPGSTVTPGSAVVEAPMPAGLGSTGSPGVEASIFSPAGVEAFMAFPGVGGSMSSGCPGVEASFNSRLRFSDSEQLNWLP